MSVMGGVMCGMPKIIPGKEIHFVGSKSILKKVGKPCFCSVDLFDYYVVEISIEKVGVNYPFPLIWKQIDGKKVYCNEPTESFYVDKIGLTDLVKYYGDTLEWTFKRGYYYDQGFNPKITVFIKTLFDLRKKYKEQKNPIEKTIKLLMNSIYGKSIIKAVPTQTVMVPKENLDRWVSQHYNFISQIHENPSQPHVYAKIIKQINDHWNLPVFGLSVLSHSKKIMNEVKCLCHQTDIPVFYTDTDSIHLLQEDIPKLREAFRKRYDRELIGTELCQFHSDFDPVNGKPSQSIKFIGCGKKCYLDILQNEDGEIGYHKRMKGIPQGVIDQYCKDWNITPEQLYMKIYYGHPIKFDLVKGSPHIQKDRTYQQYTEKMFIKTIYFPDLP
jgi:hypothetical protein